MTRLLNAFSTRQTTDVEHGYAQIVRAATSFLPGITDGSLSGQSAWNWMNSPTQGVSNQSGLNDNPKWAILPRGFGSVQQVSLCDLNSDGVVNILDVQTGISRTLNGQQCGAHNCSIVDIQGIINTVLGASCPLGN